VVIDNLDVARVSLGPPEADPPLVVDADAVLSASISTEFLQTVPRRNPQIIEQLGGIQDHEFPHGNPLERPIKST